jgi:5'(3')-deoxyribonucleotidase|nr:MAG TPA: 5' nucleotidase [Caudoviricetes sp.]
MENKKFRILIDMDDTITNFLEEVINEYNKTYGTSHSIDEVTEWVIPSSFEYGLFSVLELTNILTMITPKLDSIEYINKWIDEGYDVFIVSDCCNRYQSYRDKLKWLKTYIPKFDLSHFIPCKEKYVISGDVLIDDNLDNLEKWSLHNPYGMDLLMTAQHNKGIQDERRIYSFEEADDLIKTMQLLMSLGTEIKALEK